MFTQHLHSGTEASISFALFSKRRGVASSKKSMISDNCTYLLE